MDIPDPAATLAAVHRVLRPGGSFTFAITHPCLVPSGSRWTSAAEGGPECQVRGYVTEEYTAPPNAPGDRRRVGTYHRTLMTYLNLLTVSGFTLDQSAEPQATGLSAERQSGAAAAPMFLIAPPAVVIGLSHGLRGDGARTSDAAEVSGLFGTVCRWGQFEDSSQSGAKATSCIKALDSR